MMKLIARVLLRIGGWTAVSQPPDVNKYVLIAAPHTSNWDFVWTLAFARLYGVRIQWIGKHTLFRWPFGGFMRMLGGIPVKRDRRQSLVRQLAGMINAADSICLVVPVEGTRNHVKHWKSGFYHIARAANVPIVMGFLDYGQHRGGFGPALVPSGDLVADMDKLRAFYADKHGKFPHKGGSIRLAEEDSVAIKVLSERKSGPEPRPTAQLVADI
jgi:1-acyl-sn-glycerol-3-phosphate acyltransferase